MLDIMVEFSDFETRSIAALGGSDETRALVAAFLERRNVRPGKDH